jgi:hypothetical protein
MKSLTTAERSWRKEGLGREVCRVDFIINRVLSELFEIKSIMLDGHFW